MDLKELEDRVNAAEQHGRVRFNIDHGADGNEGLWACFATERDKQVYEQNKDGEPFDVFLLNRALIVRHSWGARVRLRAGGADRPSIGVEALTTQIDYAIAAGDYPPPEAFAKAAEDALTDDEDDEPPITYTEAFQRIDELPDWSESYKLQLFLKYLDNTETPSPAGLLAYFDELMEEDEGD